MGNACYSCSPCQDQNKISTDIFRAMEGMQHGDQLIAYIDELMEKIDRGEQEQVKKPIVVASYITCGGDLMEKLSKRLNRHVCKKCLLSTLDRQTKKVAVDVLNQARHIQCVGIALSIIAHLLDRAEQVSANKDQCLRLLCYTSALAKHMKDLDIHLGRAKLDKILRFIVKGALICALQMKANILCRFISAPLNNDDLRNLESDLVHSYGDLELEALTEALNRLAVVPGPSQGEYPPYAVELDKARNEVTKLLNLTESSLRVVVIYGVGGIGKTTLATAVFKSLDLTGYHYCRVDMDQDCKLSDLQAMQEQILRDLFKENLKLSNCTQGREKLGEAFGKALKPVFLFIDNALRQTDLEKLLPINHISGLPMRSRILATTRNLKETNICGLQHGIQFYSHRIDSVSEPEAKRILYHYVVDDMNGNFDRGVDMDGLLRICGGIPLILRIVGSHLRTKILGGERNAVSAYNDTLQYFEEWQREEFEGGEENVSESIVGFVYERLKEPCKQAFLDIAFFFYNWDRSKVADIVGEDHLHDLEVAALVTTSEEDQWKGSKKVRKTVVKMHDIVRARGTKLSKGTRISDIESFSLLLSDAQGLPESFGNMSCLQTLDMSYCSELQGLPESFGNMSCLQTLHMRECSKLQGLPESFGNMSCLQTLNMSNCWEVQGLTQTFDQLSCLQTLEIDGCERMCSFSVSFGKLKRLKFLNISNCKELNGLPEDIVCLTSLAAINANRCASLEAKAMDSLVEITSLTFLDIDDSPMLIKRWEEIIQQHPPPMGLPLRLTRHSVEGDYESDNYEPDEGDYKPDEETVSAMFFSGGSTFPHVDGESMSSFPDVGVKVCLFFTETWDILSHDVKQKVAEVASQEF